MPACKMTQCVMNAYSTYVCTVMSLLSCATVHWNILPTVGVLRPGHTGPDNENENENENDNDTNARPRLVE